MEQELDDWNPTLQSESILQKKVIAFGNKEIE